MTAASTAAVAVGKQALDAYADYEQLVGGVDTLFKDSSAKVQEYAANAFQTAGLSANAYMETVTSFSASLLQSLDGDTTAAADVANRAITDMSDNANKMGTDMQMIQNAYQGFAKQNYTMLDNLKLGYGGTKEEMERLLADASELAGVDFELSNFADVIEAIHVIQENMGITGTTAAEAAKTISGSTAAMKSAWQNLLVGISDDTQDFDGLIENLVNSVSTVADNVLPRIEVIFGGLGQLVEQLFPKIVEQIPVLVSEGLPKLVSLATTLIKTLVDGLKKNSKLLGSGAVEIVTTLISGIADMLPDVVELGLDLLVALGEGISENVGTVLGSITDVVLRIVDLLTNPETLSKMVDVAIELLTALSDGIFRALPRLVEAIPTIIDNLMTALTTNLPKITKAATTLITQLANALIENAPSIIQAGIDLLGALVEDLPTIIKSITDVLPDLIQGIIDALLDPENLDAMIDAGINLLFALVEDIPAIIGAIASAIPDIIGGIISTLTDPNNIEKFKEAGTKLWDGLIAKLPDVVEEAVGNIADLFVQFWDWLTGNDTNNKKGTRSTHTAGMAYVEAWDRGSATTSSTNNEFTFDDLEAFAAAAQATTTMTHSTAEYYEQLGREKLAQQPIVITMQMPSGVEMGRQYIEDIYAAERADGNNYRW
jgi:phage-related protein